MQEHTDCLISVAEEIVGRLQLGVCDTEVEGSLHVETDGEWVSAVLVQEKPEGPSIVAMCCRALTATERSAGRMEQLCIAALWAIKR